MLIEEFKVCLSIQRALLGKITPNLRRVCFKLELDLILLYFYYEVNLTEIEEEFPDDVSAEVIADFPEKCMINSEIIIVPATLKNNYSQGRIVFERYEE